MGLLLGRDIMDGGQRHAHLSARLRMGVLDSLLSYPLGLARLVSDAAVMSHPNADFDKAATVIKMKAYDAMAHIDYFSGGMTGTEALNTERMKAVEEYRRMRQAVMKGP